MLGALVAACAVVLLALIAAGFVARSWLKSLPTRPPPVNGPTSRWLVDYAVPYRWPLGLALILIVATTLVDLASPWPLKIMIDSAVNGDPLPAILSDFEGLSGPELALAAAGAGLGLVLLNVLLAYLITYLIGAAELRVAADMRAAVFRRLQDLSLRFHDRNRTGDLVDRLTDDVARVRDVLVAWFNQVVPEALTLVGVLVIIVLIDPLLALVSLSVVPVLLYYALAKRPQIKAAQRIARDRTGEMTSQATDVIRNVRLVQAFSRQRQVADRFRAQLDRTAAAGIASMDVSARYSPVSSVVLATGSALVSWIGVIKVINGELSLGTLIVFLSYLSGVYSPIKSLSKLVSTFAKGQASSDRLRELFDEAYTVTERADGLEAPDQPSGLALNHVTFSYDDGPPILDDFTLSVAAGETVCIVGVSGVGKSTLLALLLRLYDPVTGTVTLGGIDTLRLSVESLRQRISFVPQDPWIIDGSVRENIVFGYDRAQDDELWVAVEQACVDEFVHRLPRGLDSPTGEGGELLSGGQRRRIALARALIRDCRVLLFDEPTAGLDAGAAEDVMTAISSAAVGRTVLIVSHDLKVARRSDRVVVMEQGRIVESGTHAELLELRRRYASMWVLQRGLGRAGSQAFTVTAETVNSSS